MIINGLHVFVLFFGVLAVLVVGAGWGSWREELQRMADAERPVASPYAPLRDEAADFYDLDSFKARVDEWFAPESFEEVGND